MKAFDPIIYEEVEISEWLDSDEGNIILVFFTDALGVVTKSNYICFALKKSFIFATALNEIYVECKYKDKTFLPKETYNNRTTYFNLGYYIGKRLLVLNKKQSTLDKSRFFYVDFVINSAFIKKEYLALSYIGLYNQVEALKNKSLKTQLTQIKVNKNNMPHLKIDVYFEKILDTALKDYSYQWDQAVNQYLRIGDSYFYNLNSGFNKNNIWKRFGKTNQEAIDAVKNKIVDLDRVFLEAATKNEDTKRVYYRGMHDSIGLPIIGEETIVPNFFSITTDKRVAIGFSGIGKNKAHQIGWGGMGLGNCCLYKIYIDTGVPIINMINSTKFKHEQETLLPRNLKYTVIDILNLPSQTYYDIKSKKLERYKIIVLKVSLTREDQFYIKSECKNYLYGILKPFKKNKKDNTFITTLLDSGTPQSNKSNKSNKSNESDNDQYFSADEINDFKKQTKSPTLSNTMKNTKLPRCPNGTRRNKKTKLCEPKK